jgi:hypothetical protein
MVFCIICLDGAVKMSRLVDIWGKQQKYKNSLTVKCKKTRRGTKGLPRQGNCCEKSVNASNFPPLKIIIVVQNFKKGKV